MPGFERGLEPVQHLFVEMELVEERAERVVEHFFSDIFTATIGIAATTLSMSGAVIVDVFALLEGYHILLDIFCPPRADFLAKGWISNGGEYED